VVQRAVREAVGRSGIGKRGTGGRSGKSGKRGTSGNRGTSGTGRTGGTASGPAAKCRARRMG